MEPVVYEETPLADYLKDGGNESENEWAVPVHTPSPASSPGASPPSSPIPAKFAPTGRPSVKGRFRKAALGLEIPRPTSLPGVRRTYSAAVAASLDRTENARFLEQFRYTIVASQLLSGESILGQQRTSQKESDPTVNDSETSLLSVEGIAASVLAALAVAIVLSWISGGTSSYLTPKRTIFLTVVLVASVLVAKVYMRRQWLRYQREQSLREIKAFVKNSHDLDGVAGAALALVQEVELVSRGYRISTPLPPISRLEERAQNRKCVRLRKALRRAFNDVIPAYIQVQNVIKGFAEQTDLEKYCDVYDISDFDMSDALRGFDEAEFDDTESLRTLKIVAARFQIIRKLFLCALLALDANGEESDLLRWTAAVESLRNLNTSTKEARNNLRKLLSEEESFPSPPTPKSALSPGRERWRSQMHKLNSLSTGIRGLQAKLQLLREDSDRALNDSSDISELGAILTSQFESIGADLKELMVAWEEGKAALAVGIDRNEKRLSSMSTLLSPTTSLSGLTSVEEGGAAEAFKALTGESPVPSDMGEHEAPEVLEGLALSSRSRPHSMLSREERLIQMREEREQKAIARQQMDATRGMMRELETVINLRPRTRTSAPPPARVTSM